MINYGWRSLTALEFVGDKQVSKFIMPKIILVGSNGQVHSVHYFLDYPRSPHPVMAPINVLKPLSILKTPQNKLTSITINSPTLQRNVMEEIISMLLLPGFT